MVRATVARVERNQGRSHPPRVRSRGRAVSSGAAIAGILATIRGRARPSSRPAAAGRPAVAGRRIRMAHPVVSRRGYGEAVASGLPGGQSEVTLGRLAARAGGCVPGFAGPVLVAGNEGDLTFFVVAGEVDLPRSTPGAGAGAEVAIARGRASFLPPGIAEALPLGGDGEVVFLRLGATSIDAAVSPFTDAGDDRAAAPATGGGVETLRRAIASSSRSPKFRLRDAPSLAADVEVPIDQGQVLLVTGPIAMGPSVALPPRTTATSCLRVTMPCGVPAPAAWIVAAPPAASPPAASPTGTSRSASTPASMRARSLSSSWAAACPLRGSPPAGKVPTPTDRKPAAAGPLSVECFAPRTGRGTEWDRADRNRSSALLVTTCGRGDASMGIRHAPVRCAVNDGAGGGQMG